MSGPVMREDVGGEHVAMAMMTMMDEATVEDVVPKEGDDNSNNNAVNRPLNNVN